MSDKIWVDSHWYYDNARDAWVMTCGRAYLFTEKPDELYAIQASEIHKLIKALDEQGWIKPRLDERLRQEDLKITHRLLDLLERKHD